jgi:hypothetical protein
MRLSTRLAAVALAAGTVLVPLAGTSHAGCVQQLISDPTPSNPHSITQHYIAITTQFVACAV